MIPIRYVIETYDYKAAFLWFGLIQGGIIVVLAYFLRGPRSDEIASVPPPKVVQSTRSFTPKEVLLAPVFWLLYVMFVMVSASGLMATAQIAPIGSDFNVGNSITFFGATTLTAALIMDNLANGAARPIFGWISDHIGREFYDGNRIRGRWRFVLAVGLTWYGTMGLYSLRRADLLDMGRDI